MKGMKNAGSKMSKNDLRPNLPSRSVQPQKKASGMTKAARDGLLKNDGGQVPKR